MKDSPYRPFASTWPPEAILPAIRCPVCKELVDVVDSDAYNVTLRHHGWRRDFTRNVAVYDTGSWAKSTHARDKTEKAAAHEPTGPDTDDLRGYFK